MLFRSTDLLNDFERMTKGLHFGPEFEQAIEDISTNLGDVFAGAFRGTPDVAHTADADSSPDADSAFEADSSPIVERIFDRPTKTKRPTDVDIVRSAEIFELYVDLPGIDASTVDLTVDGRTLTIAADRTFALREDQEHVHAGRRHGAFHRTFELAEDLDIDALAARSENGVLIVTIPVVAAPEPRKIHISTEG